MLTVRQAAERASVSQSLVYEWCSSGILPHMRLGRPGKRGCIRIDEADLENFLAQCHQEARPQTNLPPLKHIKLG
jgi:excisionase family DNA binding protein